MSVTELNQAVQDGDVTRAKELLDTGVDVNGHGEEQEWTPLNYASGRGDLEMVTLLLERGADVFNVGSDQRTPYEIALAASRVKVAQLLRETEDKVDPERAQTSSRRAPKYCKAYYLRDLRQFPDWTENELPGPEEEAQAGETSDEATPLPEDQVVFLHTDLTVTRSMWHNEDVVFDQVTPDWEAFCSRTLKFKVPDDLELVTQAQAANSN
jgi:hypothetical protein